MPIPIPGKLIEFILLGPDDDRRQLQDSPVLGDVWIEFGKAPADPHDLLITPIKTRHAGEVAVIINRGLGETNSADNVAYLQGLVVATLTFEELIRVIVPKTKWWIDKWVPLPSDAPAGQGGERRPARYEHEVVRRYYGDKPPTNLVDTLKNILGAASHWHTKAMRARFAPDTTPFDRFAALTGLILWAGEVKNPFKKQLPPTDELIGHIIEQSQKDVRKIAKTLDLFARKMLADPAWQAKDGGKAEALVWQVSVNRAARPALIRSIPAVKADAATNLFKINCSRIGWAVLDGGIDGTHPAFKNSAKQSRVKRSFEFKDFRRIVSLSNTRPQLRKANVDSLINNPDLLNPPTAAVADANLERLAQDAETRGPINWELVEPFIEIKSGTPPTGNHGTHVAGIIGASKDAACNGLTISDDEANTIGIADGMCPDISLYDFRVLGNDLAETEFAIIAALQFIRYINDRDDFFTIHGANLSLSIRHDVRNYACGRTPICNECERLIDSGIVVVAAAGNHGYKSFETKDGAFESYAAFSITDPGNADGVITVGSTHRNWPHTYGVSFFSSRGPTGDGRPKPDLVAPGERIRAPFPNGEWADLDGTSMAAPHVSGAAAMLMARYSELIGQPRLVKKILCDTATDLDRERSFQGHGMLDVLRALQSV